MAQHGEGIYLGDTVAKTNQHQVLNSGSEVSECCSAQKMQLWEFRDFILHVCEIPQYQQRFLNSAPSTKAAQGKAMALQGQQLLPQSPWLPQHCQDWFLLSQTIPVSSHPPQGHFQGLLDLRTPSVPGKYILSLTQGRDIFCHPGKAQSSHFRLGCTLT